MKKYYLKIRANSRAVFCAVKIHYVYKSFAFLNCNQTSRHSVMNRFLNCWEFKKCGREPKGKNTEQYGVCSVAMEITCDGLNGGKNGGRSCWLWRETACAKIMKKSSVQCIRECRECNFYYSVKQARLDQLWKKFYRIVGR